MNKHPFLGEFTSPVLVFGGAYSNLQATQAMQQEALRRGIAPDHIICNGDIIAYCAEPAATLDLIRDWDIHVVMGNCEESLGEASSDCGCGFEVGSTCSVLSVNWYKFALSQVRHDQQLWMQSLPRCTEFKMQSQKVAVIHGGVESINKFIFPSTPDIEKSAELSKSKADVVIGGHSGIPFGQNIDGGSWLNSGAIGMPANDGTQRGWFMILTPSPSGIEVSWHALHFDADTTKKVMLENGLDQGYDQCLINGLWPSMDVLPETERKERGMALEIPKLLIENKPKS